MKGHFVRLASIRAKDEYSSWPGVVYTAYCHLMTLLSLIFLILNTVFVDI